MTGRWRIHKDADEAPFEPWLVESPECDGPEGSHPPPCAEFGNHAAAVAYVDAQIRARALTALEGQP